MPKRILTFGAFDPLHEGHKNLFTQARALGDQLHVVVARDSMIAAVKGHTAHVAEQDRLQAVLAQGGVDSAQLGDEQPEDYTLLRSLEFDVLAAGYDQEPDDAGMTELLAAAGQTAPVVRLLAHRPDVYKSSLLRE